MSVANELTRLFNLSTVYLPGATLGAMQIEVFEVFHEFFNKSNCWTEEITVSETTTKLSYELDVDTGSATILRLISYKNSEGVDFRAYMDEPGILTIPQLPAEASDKYAKVSLTVKDPVDTNGYPIVPEWVFSKYRDTLRCGLVGRMMMQKAKPYTDERMGIYNLRRFQSGIGVAKTEATHSNLYRGQTWAFPRTFATSRRQ